MPAKAPGGGGGAPAKGAGGGGSNRPRAASAPRAGRGSGATTTGGHKSQGSRRHKAHRTLRPEEEKHEREVAVVWPCGSDNSQEASLTAPTTTLTITATTGTSSANAPQSNKSSNATCPALALPPSAPAPASTTAATATTRRPPRQARSRKKEDSSAHKDKEEKKDRSGDKTSVKKGSSKAHTESQRTVPATKDMDSKAQSQAQIQAQIQAQSVALAKAQAQAAAAQAQAFALAQSLAVAQAQAQALQNQTKGKSNTNTAVTAFSLQKAQMASSFAARSRSSVKKQVRRRLPQKPPSAPSAASTSRYPRAVKRSATPPQLQHTSRDSMASACPGGTHMPLPNKVALVLGGQTLMTSTVGRGGNAPSRPSTPEDEQKSVDVSGGAGGSAGAPSGGDPPPPPRPSGARRSMEHLKASRPGHARPVAKKRSVPSRRPGSGKGALPNASSTTGTAAMTVTVEKTSKSSGKMAGKSSIPEMAYAWHSRQAATHPELHAAFFEAKNNSKEVPDGTVAAYPPPPSTNPFPPFSSVPPSSGPHQGTPAPHHGAIGSAASGWYPFASSHVDRQPGHSDGPLPSGGPPPAAGGPNAAAAGEGVGVQKTYDGTNPTQLSSTHAPLLRNTVDGHPGGDTLKQGNWGPSVDSQWGWGSWTIPPPEDFQTPATWEHGRRGGDNLEGVLKAAQERTASRDRTDALYAASVTNDNSCNRQQHSASNDAPAPRPATTTSQTLRCYTTYRATVHTQPIGWPPPFQRLEGSAPSEDGSWTSHHRYSGDSQNVIPPLGNTNSHGELLTHDSSPATNQRPATAPSRSASDVPVLTLSGDRIVKDPSPQEMSERSSVSLGLFRGITPPILSRNRQRVRNARRRRTNYSPIADRSMGTIDGSTWSMGGAHGGGGGGSQVIGGGGSMALRHAVRQALRHAMKASPGGKDKRRNVCEAVLQAARHAAVMGLPQRHRKNVVKSSTKTSTSPMVSPRKPIRSNLSARSVIKGLTDHTLGNVTASGKRRVMTEVWHHIQDEIDGYEGDTESVRSRGSGEARVSRTEREGRALVRRPHRTAAQRRREASTLQLRSQDSTDEPRSRDLRAGGERATRRRHRRPHHRATGASGRLSFMNPPESPLGTMLPQLPAPPTASTARPSTSHLTQLRRAPRERSKAPARGGIPRAPSPHATPESTSSDDFPLGPRHPPRLRRRRRREYSEETPWTAAMLAKAATKALSPHKSRADRPIGATAPSTSARAPSNVGSFPAPPLPAGASALRVSGVAGRGRVPGAMLSRRRRSASRRPPYRTAQPPRIRRASSSSDLSPRPPPTPVSASTDSDRGGGGRGDRGGRGRGDAGGRGRGGGGGEGRGDRMRWAEAAIYSVLASQPSASLLFPFIGLRRPMQREVAAPPPTPRGENESDIVLDRFLVQDPTYHNAPAPEAAPGQPRRFHSLRAAVAATARFAHEATERAATVAREAEQRLATMRSGLEMASPRSFGRAARAAAAAGATTTTTVATVAVTTSTTITAPVNTNFSPDMQPPPSSQLSITTISQESEILPPPLQLDAAIGAADKERAAAARHLDRAARVLQRDANSVYCAFERAQQRTTQALESVARFTSSAALGTGSIAGGVGGGGGGGGGARSALANGGGAGGAAGGGVGGSANEGEGGGSGSGALGTTTSLAGATVAQQQQQQQQPQPNPALATSTARGGAIPRRRQSPHTTNTSRHLPSSVALSRPHHPQALPPSSHLTLGSNTQGPAGVQGDASAQLQELRNGALQASTLSVKGSHPSPPSFASMSSAGAHPAPSQHQRVHPAPSQHQRRHHHHHQRRPPSLASSSRGGIRSSKGGGGGGGGARGGCVRVRGRSGSGSGGVGGQHRGGGGGGGGAVGAGAGRIRGRGRGGCSGRIGRGGGTSGRVPPPHQSSSYTLHHHPLRHRPHNPPCSASTYAHSFEPYDSAASLAKYTQLQEQQMQQVSPPPARPQPPAHAVSQGANPQDYGVPLLGYRTASDMSSWVEQPGWGWFQPGSASEVAATAAAIAASASAPPLQPPPPPPAYSSATTLPPVSATPSATARHSKAPSPALSAGAFVVAEAPPLPPGPPHPPPSATPQNPHHPNPSPSPRPQRARPHLSRPLY